MHRRSPRLRALPGTAVTARRCIILPQRPTAKAITDALRTLAEAAERGEHCPTIIAPWANQQHK